MNQSAADRKTDASKKPEFERSLARLEKIVATLENAELSLDDAMKLFEEGVQLTRQCQKHLEDAAGRVEVLMKKAEGTLATEPFETDDEEEAS